VATILFFGRLQDEVGASRLTAALPDGVRDAEGLRSWLGREHPALLDPAVRMAVNATFCAAGAPIAESDEIAFLSPMSGG
jgi:molybdopterin converting factor subunit 1